jgi:predicted  nucleic acid-binding Zn-ribbon protein
VQAKGAGAPVSAPRLAQQAAPAKAEGAEQAAIAGDTFQARASSDDPLAILQDWKANRGGLWENGFWSNPKIDAAKALDLLKKGKDILVKNPFGEKDEVKSIAELLLLNSLDGPAADHPGTDPNLRLPLLYLAGKRITTGDTEERISNFVAYKRFRGNDEVKVDKKKVKAADLPALARAAVPAGADPGGAIDASVKLSGDQEGWKVNGRDVGRDVLYMAFLKGSGHINFRGNPVQGTDGLRLVNYLLLGAEGDKLPASLKAGADRFKALTAHLPAPDVDAYSAFFKLQNGQNVRFGKNTVASFAELATLNALEGDKQPIPGLDAGLQSALIAMDDGGLSAGGAFATHKALSGGTPATYTFRGGPTHEPITMTMTSLDAVVGVKKQVDAQREADQFRPEIGVFKTLLSDRGSVLKATAQGHQALSQASKAAAQADIPRQEEVIRVAQARYDDNSVRYNAVAIRLGSAREELRDAQNHFYYVRIEYERKRDEVEWLQNREDRLSREISDLDRSAASEDSKAAKEDQLAANPPAGSNPDVHKARAAEHRAKAKQYRDQAANKRRDLRDVRWELERARQELYRYEQTYNDARYRVERAERRVSDLESEAAGYRAAMNAASDQMAVAREAIKQDQATIRDNDAVLAMGPSISRPAERLLTNGDKVASHADFAAKRAEFQGDAQQLATHAANETYRRVHGAELAERLAPIQALLNAMDKPAPNR